MHIFVRLFNIESGSKFKSRIFTSVCANFAITSGKSYVFIGKFGTEVLTELLQSVAESQNLFKRKRHYIKKLLIMFY